MLFHICEHRMHLATHVMCHRNVLCLIGASRKAVGVGAFIDEVANSANGYCYIVCAISAMRYVIARCVNNLIMKYSGILLGYLSAKLMFDLILATE